MLNAHYFLSQSNVLMNSNFDNSLSVYKSIGKNSLNGRWIGKQNTTSNERKTTASAYKKIANIGENLIVERIMSNYEQFGGDAVNANDYITNYPLIDVFAVVNGIDYFMQVKTDTNNNGKYPSMSALHKKALIQLAKKHNAVPMLVNCNPYTRECTGIDLLTGEKYDI
jgi:hypothetical protein